MKVERFIKEYANYQKKCIAENALMNDEYKEEAIEEINQVLKARACGRITPNEAINIILNCFGKNA